MCAVSIGRMIKLVSFAITIDRPYTPLCLKNDLMGDDCAVSDVKSVHLGCYFRSRARTSGDGVSEIVSLFQRSTAL